MPGGRLLPTDGLDETLITLPIFDRIKSLDRVRRNVPNVSMHTLFFYLYSRGSFEYRIVFDTKLVTNKIDYNPQLGTFRVRL
jgi:hypothetical protein